jgi:hypothetical protein
VDMRERDNQELKAKVKEARVEVSSDEDTE